MKKSNVLAKTVQLLLLLLSLNSFGQNPKKQILLIGTFHFNNPGYDLAKVNTFDVMTEKSQQELEVITNKIKKFNPDKIFVEWEYNQQSELDSLYDKYSHGQYFSFVNEKFPKSNFYKQNEIFQLAFKAALKCKHSKVYAIDYTDVVFPYDSLMSSIVKANQFLLKNEIENKIKTIETESNLDRTKLSLTQLLLKCNEAKQRKNDLKGYITLLNKAGEKTNFVGSYTVSEWYKRNLYMYSLIQKITEAKDSKIVVLLGASHIAMLKEFIKLDENFNSIELKEILK